MNRPPGTIPSGPSGQAPTVGVSSGAGRWVLAAAVLGSGMAFLDGTVVNVALPAIARALGGGLVVQQWVLDSYLLTLSALLLLGGALGDHYGRKRVFLVGLVVFGLSSLACGVAPNASALITARAIQGVGGALLVPGSLALIDSIIRPEDRGRAVGTWAGLSGVASALGPLLGGYLVDAASWRFVFFINLPLAAAALALTMWRVPESRDPTATGHPDLAGALAATVGMAGVIYGLIQVPEQGWRPASATAVIVGGLALLAFPVVEVHRRQPLLPLAMFRSAQFTGANLCTLALYAGMGGALFLLALQLQESLRYSPVAAGLALLPITVIMLLVSPRMGALAQRTGPRLPMTAGPVVAGVGLALMARVTPGASYLGSVFPAVVLFGAGLSIAVAPLTSTVLASVPEEHVGAASGTNNAVSRSASLLAVAVLPVVAGVHTGTGPLGPGFSRAMLIAAVVCLLGGLVSAVTIRAGVRVRHAPLPGIYHACADPCVRQRPPTGGPEDDPG